MPEDEPHPELSYYQQASVAEDSTFSVEASTDFGASWTPLTTSDSGEPIETWMPRKLSLEGYQGQWITLRFRALQGASQAVDTWLIDDVQVSERTEIPPPTVGPITASARPSSLGAPVTLTAPFSQPGYSGTHTAQWDWGDGTTSVGSISQDGEAGSVEDSHIYTLPATYTVTLTVTDQAGGEGAAALELSADITPDTPGTIELNRVTAFYNLTHTGGTLGYSRWSWQNHVGAPERYWIHVDQAGEWMYFFHAIPNDPATFDSGKPEEVMGNYLALAVTKEDFQKWFWCGIKLYDQYYRFQGYGCHSDWSPPPYGAGEFHPWYQARIDKSGQHIQAILEHTYGE